MDAAPRHTATSDRRLPGPAVAIGLVVFCAAVLVFVGYRRQAAIEASGPLLVLVPFTPDDAVAVRGTVDDKPGGFLLRVHRAQGMRWTRELPAVPGDAGGLRVRPDQERVAVRLGDAGWRSFALEDGAPQGEVPEPPPRPEPTLPSALDFLLGPDDALLDVALGDGGALVLVGPRVLRRDADGAPETAPATAKDTTADDAKRMEGPSHRLSHCRLPAATCTWTRAASPGARVVAIDDDLYAQSRKGLLLRVRASDGEVLAAARAPGGADAGYPLARHLFVRDRLWLHDDVVMVTLDRHTLRTLVGLDRIRAVPVLDALDEEWPVLDPS
jgi:hypothetical protein